MTFPSTPVLDTFDRANSGTLGSAWSEVFGIGARWGISGNLAAPQAAQSSEYWNATTYGDCEGYFTITTKPANSTGSVTIGLRLGGVGSIATFDGYAISVLPVTGTDIIRVQRVDNGSGTILGSDLNQEVAVNDVFGARMVGSTIYVYLNGTEIMSRTDTTYTSGYIGIVAAETTTRINDFGGGAYVAPSRTGRGMLTMGVR